MLRLAFDFIITWRETRTRPNAYALIDVLLLFLPIGINARLFFISEEWLLLFMCG